MSVRMVRVTLIFFFFFFFNYTATTEIYTLSLHDALPIYYQRSTPQVGLSTVSVMGAVIVRPCASVIVARIFLTPVGTNAPTPAVRENSSSSVSLSPCVPSSKSCESRPPPMLVRSAETARPVLGGFVAGVTFTVNNVFPAGGTEAGVAVPTPEGCEGSPPQVFAGAALFRGIGPITTKSLRLLSESTQPLFLRTAAFVLPNAGAATVSEQ